MSNYLCQPCQNNTLKIQDQQPSTAEHAEDVKAYPSVEEKRKKIKVEETNKQAQAGDEDSGTPGSFTEDTDAPLK
ncbi:hypothetical protein CHARACLAT_013809 [Characodon lateralis]|uniref:Uncharacterized protein n=1 Tax=Characodon lateralis TaxID=208331 RepID=A0ABU7E0C5_9TELE|nr:hypothetical protein [Characodon lateralis]